MNVGLLDQLEDGTEVSPETLVELKLMRDAKDPLKILGNGELTHKITVKANKFSAAAIAKIEAVGGTVVTL